jgi:hypothetical protein
MGNFRPLTLNTPFILEPLEAVVRAQRMAEMEGYPFLVIIEPSGLLLVVPDTGRTDETILERCHP